MNTRFALQSDVSAVTKCSLKNAVGMNPDYAKTYSAKLRQDLFTPFRFPYSLDICWSKAYWDSDELKSVLRQWWIQNAHNKTVSIRKKVAFYFLFLNFLFPNVSDRTEMLKDLHLLLGLLSGTSRKDIRWYEEHRSVLSCKQEEDTISLNSLVSRSTSKTQLITFSNAT